MGIKSLRKSGKRRNHDPATRQGRTQSGSGEKLQETISGALGDNAVLKTGPNSPTLEILDVDSEAITEELIEAVCTVANSARETINILRMVSSYGGSLSARRNSHHLT